MEFSLNAGALPTVVIFGVVAVGSWIALMVCLFIIKVGNAEFEVRADSRSPFELVDLAQTRATFRTNIEFANTGKQCGTIMDCYIRHLLPYEQFDGVEVSSKAQLKGAPREDDYFEAVLIQRGESIFIEVLVALAARKSDDIREAVADMPDMPIDVVYQYVARDPWAIDKKRIVLKGAEVRELVARKTEKAEG